ncbi:hypothetical protein N8649_02145 [bacterium]|nr:hypothetical protein [bacterium]
MKVLIPLLFLTLGVNANEVVYGSKHGEAVEKEETNEFKPVTILELKNGEIFEILSVTAQIPGNSNNLSAAFFTQYGEQPAMPYSNWLFSNDNARENFGNSRPAGKRIVVGPCKISLVGYDASRTAPKMWWQVSYKITKPSAAGTTTSAPILLPPTQDAAKSWFVKLQVSSDLKAWDDVAPGQFLGSDTARFFRIQTTEAE